MPRPLIKGPIRGGFLRGEVGTHRLVRISPFNAAANARRPSPAWMSVPEAMSDEIEIEINENDLELNFYARRQGRGQNVNKESACASRTCRPALS